MEREYWNRDVNIQDTQEDISYLQEQDGLHVRAKARLLAGFFWLARHPLWEELWLDAGPALFE